MRPYRYLGLYTEKFGSAESFAVYLTEEFLEGTTTPYYNGEITYGDRAEHCWNGDPTEPNAITRLCYHRMFIPKWAKTVGLLAPEGADLTSWRY